MGLHQILLQTFNKIEGMRVKKIKPEANINGVIYDKPVQAANDGLILYKKSLRPGSGSPLLKK